MYFKFIFIIILIILIIYLNNKNKNHNNEELITITDNIKKLTYSYIFNNDNIKYYINNINNLINFNNNGSYLNESFNTDISGVIDISGIMNINNSIKFLNMDIRQYLIGCSIFNMETDLNFAKYVNSDIKLDLQQGLYNLLQTTDVTGSIFKAFNDYVDVIIVYPGFGIYAWENYFSGQYIIIENYGTKPLKILLNTGNNILDSNTINTLNNISNISNIPTDSNIIPINLLYNGDSSTYKIIKSSNFTNMSNKISVINVYSLSIDKWINHKP